MYCDFKANWLQLLSVRGTEKERERERERGNPTQNSLSLLFFLTPALTLTLFDKGLQLLNVINPGSATFAFTFTYPVSIISN
jgi:hypothetical protein